MASHLGQSLTESIQASIIIQRREKQKLELSKLTTTTEGENNKEGKESENNTSTKGPSLCYQYSMVVMFMGLEVSAAFSLIYQILFLQFLGVPTSQMSLGGVISGGAVIFLLPLLGWLIDRGSNPLRRKVLSIILCFGIFLLGYTGIGICCIAKLYPPGNVTHHETTTANPDGIHENLYSQMLWKENEITLLTNSSYFLTNHTDDVASIPIILEENMKQYGSKPNMGTINSPNAFSYIGLVSFSLIDIGFMACISIGRAFLLECTPVAIHTKLLIMATTAASFAGCAICLILTIDFPGYLGPRLGVDGTAATVLMLSCYNIILIAVCMVCSVVTGYISRSKTSNESIELVDSNAHHYGDVERMPRIPTETRLRAFSWRNNSLLSLSVRESIHGGSVTEPLLGKNSVDDRSYSALSTAPSMENIFTPTTSSNPTSESTGIFDKLQYQRIPFPKEDDVDIIYEDKPYLIKPKVQSSTDNVKDNVHDNPDSDDNDDDNPDSDDNDDVDDDSYFNSLSDDDKSLISQSGSISDGRSIESDGKGREVEESGEGEDNKITSIMGAIIASYSVSMSMVQSSIFGDFQNSKISKDLRVVAVTNAQNQKDGPTKRNINKRMVILCLSIFFTMGCMCGYSLYAGNTLTIGIYHGVPSALPGMEGRYQYEKGLRVAAMGNLVFYLAYTVFSAMNKKLIDIIGEINLYMICQGVIVATLTAFVITKTVEIFFLTTVMSGCYRACAFTLGYILAHKFSEEEIASNTSSSTTQTSKNSGRTMVLIGLVMPSHFLLLSLYMGVLISVSGVWVPMYYAIVNGGLSLFVISFVFFVKR